MSANASTVSSPALEPAPNRMSLTGVRTAALVFLGLLFSAPYLLPMHRGPQATFDVEFFAAVLAAALAITLALGKVPALKVNWPFPAWLVAFVLIVAGQYAAGVLHYSNQLTTACVYAFALIGSYLIG